MHFTMDLLMTSNLPANDRSKPVEWSHKMQKKKETKKKQTPFFPSNYHFILNVRLNTLNSSYYWYKEFFEKGIILYLIEAARYVM